VRLTDEERARTRSMIVDADGMVIADSSKAGHERERFDLPADAAAAGTFRTAGGALVGYALTPGYETYQGMGWFGVIEQKPRQET